MQGAFQLAVPDSRTGGLASRSAPRLPVCGMGELGCSDLKSSPNPDFLGILQSTCGCPEQIPFRFPILLTVAPILPILLSPG